MAISRFANSSLAGDKMLAILIGYRIGFVTVHVVVNTRVQFSTVFIHRRYDRVCDLADFPLCEDLFVAEAP